jgi:zeaxanthin glucosyltransferase
MSHYAILCPDEGGHLLSMGPLGTELVRRGHRVTVLARAMAAPLAEQLGLALHPLDMDHVRYSPGFPLWPLFVPFGAAWVAYLRDFFRWQAEAVLGLVPPALEELAIDGILVDQVLSAGGTAAERAGVPFVTVCTALPWNEEAGVPPAYTSWPCAEGRRAAWRNRLGYGGWHWFIRPILGTINRHRRRWSLAPLERIGEVFSSLAQISQLCGELDFPRRELPDVFHYIGSFAADRRMNTDHQFPWDRLDGRPLIFASLGTIPDAANLPVFRNILAACAGLEAQLVLALGNWDDEDESIRDRLGELPGNAIVIDFAPQLALLDRAALLITHAGVNTVLESLTRGVPMVALPRNVDQPAMALRIAHAGAGLVGSFHRSTVREIHRLVGRVLAEETFRRRAKELQQAMIAAGGVTRAADIAEEALATRRPVRRQSAAGPPHFTRPAEALSASPEATA